MAVILAALRPPTTPVRRHARRRQCHNCLQMFVEYSECEPSGAYTRLTLLDDDTPVYCSSDCRATAAILHIQNTWAHAHCAGADYGLARHANSRLAAKPDGGSSPRAIPFRRWSSDARDPDSLL
ncbi:hypothetical protein SPRG_07692 [Saprolegnia parasitica CBS 223.65]|uniref:Uncharacterized protein n=1 Tax=Saprolegnia parasitica (strain CBS 223.65) TaxID=695850 RepID=A0A067C871_SAPPC|nr:hypothetical protein SPRG_07692 [Saprolegnia parasitica CBS 223.65]KDO26979.1 hypothetical protein SPRG_07692 [Saprolegnia parasitica CBS 223.65]|eukprot:XP_012202360.1 hypothetical protein SPRG_07692 [Saprolegnia parasitica CBS 223.65]